MAVYAGDWVWWGLWFLYALEVVMLLKGPLVVWMWRMGLGVADGEVLMGARRVVM